MLHAQRLDNCIGLSVTSAQQLKSVIAPTFVPLNAFRPAYVIMVFFFSLWNLLKANRKVVSAHYGGTTCKPQAFSLWLGWFLLFRHFFCINLFSLSNYLNDIFMVSLSGGTCCGPGPFFLLSSLFPVGQPIKEKQKCCYLETVYYQHLIP